jgi:Putative prokaryotic signal transducing protein
VRVIEFLQSRLVSMIRLTSVNGTFGAHVLAARLADEGFDVELRGPGTGPYGQGLTIGDMARVDVYVPDDQVDDASYVLLVTEVDNALDDDPPRRVSWSVWRVVAAVLLFAVLAAAVAEVVGSPNAGRSRDRPTNSLPRLLPAQPAPSN